MRFLEQKPTTFSKGQIHRIGSALRAGKEIDEGLYRLILVQQSALCDHLESLAVSALGESGVPLERSTNAVVEPDSNRFFIGSRVKTRPVLVEKLRRMPSFPLESIQDFSGVRMDFDVSLSEQTKVAELLAQYLEEQGAARVKIQDMREKPHSGYRAIHLHSYSPAGRAEFQLRTALQSRWANLYELAGDLYGRGIRYLEFGEQVPRQFNTQVRSLHELSDVVYKVERYFDVLSPPFAEHIVETVELREARLLRQKTSTMLDRLISELDKRRADNESERSE
ncbi:nucleotidyltransferase family protein [Corynebacterium singulare]|uniref:hypothetical protein n=1 Tax=Corynebacterium singulare TaxID=161899 RepID=UPI0011AA2EC6|nr:hypothetical protein [Corynebacterium singulare]